MVTLGFSCSWSGVLTIGTPILFSNPSISATTYLIVDTTAGDIVYKNAQGVIQVWKAASPGLNLIAAVEVLTSATINSVMYTTTANVVGWAASSTY